MFDIRHLAKGERTVLRRLSPADLADFQAYRTDPEVGQYQSWAENNDDEALRFLEDMSVAPLLQPGEWCQIGIALTVTNKLIGDIGVCLDKDASGAEIGVTLSPDHQHGGLAREAIDLAFGWIFETSAALRVYAIADKRNASALKLMQRLGMAFEAEYETEFEGEPCVEIRYAMERSDLRH